MALEGVCRVAVSPAAIAKQQHHYEVEVEELQARCCAHPCSCASEGCCCNSRDVAPH